MEEIRQGGVYKCDHCYRGINFLLTIKKGRNK